MEAVELDPVQEQLEGTLANLGEELIVACPVSERARKRQRGKAKKLAVLALTVDAKSQARVHQFNRVAEDNVAQVPKLTQLLSHLTRIVDDDDAGDDDGAFELHFEGGKELGCVAETLDLQKEFCWCCLHICHASRRMPSSNIDYIDLSLWAQAHGLEEAYALSHAIFRQRGEDALRGDGEPGSDVQGLMTSAEENDVLELLDQSQMSISDVRKFEVQLADKLRALEESNIHSILQSVELAEDVCFRLDTASNAVDELTSWIEDKDKELVDIQDGIKEIESQNNKLDTVHRSNEKLEGTLREVLEQLSMPDDMQAALLEGELGVESRAGRKLAMEERVVPAARRLALGLQLELKSGMQVRTPLKTRPHAGNSWLLTRLSSAFGNRRCRWCASRSLSSSSCAPSLRRGRTSASRRVSTTRRRCCARRTPRTAIAPTRWATALRSTPPRWPTSRRCWASSKCSTAVRAHPLASLRRLFE